MIGEDDCGACHALRDHMNGVAYAFGVTEYKYQCGTCLREFLVVLTEHSMGTKSSISELKREQRSQADPD